MVERLAKAFACLVVIGGVSLTVLLVHSTFMTASSPNFPRQKHNRRLSVVKFPDVVLKQVGVASKDDATRQRKLLKFSRDRGLNLPWLNGPAQAVKKNTNLGSFPRGDNRLGRAGSRLLNHLEDDAPEGARENLFHDEFFFPQPKIMRSLSDISQSPWVKDLQRYLTNYNYTREISVVTSNSKYVDVLLNWLIAATVKNNVPAGSVLIISLDITIHRLMLAKQFCSILVPPRSLIAADVTFSQPFEEVMMTRLAIMRVINHFGHSFVMYDTDAVLLKDPQPLYDAIPRDDIIGSVGKIPYDLAAEWGITICIGVVLIRSSPRVESYWNSMMDVCPESVDDQEKLNCGLKALNIDWLNNSSNYQNTTVTGVASNHLRVSVLPYDNICRQTTCTPESRSTMYIWHKGGQRSRRDKLVSAREGQTWFLRYQWEKIRNKLVGTKWLESIAYYTVLHA